MNSIFWESLEKEDFKEAESPVLDWLVLNADLELARKFWFYFCDKPMGNKPKKPRKAVKKFLANTDLSPTQSCKEIGVFCERTIYRLLSEKK